MIVELARVVEKPKQQMKEMLGVGLAADVSAQKIRNWSDEFLAHFLEAGNRSVMGEQPRAKTKRMGVLGAERSTVEGHRITRWPEALPHYTVDLERVLPQLQGMKNGVILIGNYLGDIGLARILERAARLPEEIRGAK